MKNLVYIIVFTSLLIFSCGSQKNSSKISRVAEEEKPVRIANDSLEYEITIFDIGFNTYLNSIARPMSYYSNQFLSSRNIIFVREWNNRARNLTQFDGNIYENVIDYQSGIDYGLEVNYKLFWYFQFAQRKYNMKLSNFRVYGIGGSVLPY